MPKKFFISTLILTVGGLINLATSSPPVSAMVKKDNVLYWSLDEMIAFNTKLEAETAAACGNDEMCKEMYIYEQKNQSEIPEKYRALEYFKGACRLIFFDINPAAETFKAYYMDKDDAMGMMNGSFAIEEIYIAWVEKTVADPRYQAFWDNGNAITPYVQDMRNGVMSPGVHKLYQGTSEMFGENWFTPETKITIDAPNSQLKDNQNHLIHFTVIASKIGASSGNMLGATDYSSCFKWGTYREGMECRIMYSGTGWPVYFPAFPGEEITGVEVIAEPEPEPEPESEITPEPELESEPGITPDELKTTKAEPAKETPVISENTSVIPDLEPISAEIPVISTSTIRVPTTPVVATLVTVTTSESTPEAISKTVPDDQIAVPLAAGKEEIHKFPWWFVVFIFSGIILILWWFIPLEKRKKR